MSYDKEWFAPNGGAFSHKNLNAKSEHPNPWRPPTIWESWLKFGNSDMHLTTFNQPVLKSQRIEFEEVGLTKNLQKFAIFGLKAGTTHALLDVAKVKETLPMRQIFGRWAYITCPWLAMTTSYVAIHQVYNMMSEEKNQKWMYFADALPSGFIWGIFKRNFGSGFRMAFFGGILGLTYKLAMDTGFGFGQVFSRALQYSILDNTTPFADPVNNDAKGSFNKPNYWKNSDVPTWPTRNHDEEWRGYQNVIEPSWKKHLPVEDRNKGPPTNY